jgi:hypothetical protein
MPDETAIPEPLDQQLPLFAFLASLKHASKEERLPELGILPPQAITCVDDWIYRP